MNLLVLGVAHDVSDEELDELEAVNGSQGSQKQNTPLWGKYCLLHKLLTDILWGVGGSFCRET